MSRRRLLLDLVLVTLLVTEPAWGHTTAQCVVSVACQDAVKAAVAAALVTAQQQIAGAIQTGKDLQRALDDAVIARITRDWSDAKAALEPLQQELTATIANLDAAMNGLAAAAGIESRLRADLADARTNVAEVNQVIIAQAAVVSDLRAKLAALPAPQLFMFKDRALQWLDNSTAANPATKTVLLCALGTEPTNYLYNATQPVTGGPGTIQTIGVVGLLPGPGSYACTARAENAGGVSPTTKPLFFVFAPDPPVVTPPPPPPVVTPPGAPSFTLTWAGKTIDRVGQGAGLPTPDGKLDGVFTLTAGAPARIIYLRLTSFAPGVPRSENPQGCWDTSRQPAPCGAGFLGDIWLLGVAVGDTATLLNDPASDQIAVDVPAGGSLRLYASDVEGMMAGVAEFAPGTTLWLEITLGDGTVTSTTVKP